MEVTAVESVEDGGSMRMKLKISFFCDVALHRWVIRSRLFRNNLVTLSSKRRNAPRMPELPKRRTRLSPSILLGHFYPLIQGPNAVSKCRDPTSRRRSVHARRTELAILQLFGQQKFESVGKGRWVFVNMQSGESVL
jgi:hypothetical protein